MSGIFDRGLTLFRDALLSESELNQREKAKGVCDLMKVVAIVVGVVSLFFLVSFPNVFGFLFATLGLLTSHDVYRIADNALKILNSVTKELQARASEQNVINDLTKDTLVAGPIARILVNN